MTFAQVPPGVAIFFDANSLICQLAKYSAHRASRR
jgi:hypothetical protein